MYYLEQEDNFIFYFKELKSHTTWEVLRDIIIISPLFLISQFMQIYFEILIIYYLNPMYCLLLNNVRYGIQHLLLFLFNIKMDYFLNFILLETAEILDAFGNMIYLEIIELNFCGLSDNIKRKIIIKGEKEFNKLNEDKIENIINPDENEENGEENTYIGIEKYEEMIEKNKKDNK